MISKNEFYSRVKKLDKISSSTGRANYSELTVINSLLSFRRDNTNQYWQLDLDDLYLAYTKEQYFNTTILKKHIKGRVFSPSLAVLKAIDACDKNGFRR